MDTCKFSRDSDDFWFFLRVNPRTGDSQIYPLAFSVRGLTNGVFYLFWFV